jgi:hypothetical protein
MIISITDEQWNFLVRLLKDKKRDFEKDWLGNAVKVLNSSKLQKETFDLYKHLEERDKRRLELVEDLLSELGANEGCFSHQQKSCKEQ